MKRKLLILLMAILVVMAMMPTAAFAANGTGHKISVKVYKVVLDSSKPLGYQNPEMIKTITVTCQDSTGHSGYNHSVKLKEFYPTNVNASTTDWTGWEFDLYYTKGKERKPFFASTRDTVNATANVTGREPYPCSKSFYLVYKDSTPPAPVKPDAPNDEKIQEILGENAVEVECTATTTTHTPKTKSYGLLAGSYNVGTVQGDASTGYTVEVTVKSANYVSDFDRITGNTHTPANESKHITLKYNSTNKTWSVDPASQKPIKFDVVCEETPAPSTEPKIDQDTIKTLLLGKAVCVDCTTDENHADQYYEYEDDFECTNVQNGECIVTLVDIDEDAYIQKYSDDVDKEHKKGTNASTSTVLLKYDTDTMRWTLKTPAHIYVECEETSTEPKIDQDTIKTLLLGKAVCVDCTTDENHADQYYEYEDDFECTNVQNGECIVTLVDIDEDAYIQKYSDDVDKEHKKGTNASTSTVLLKYDTDTMRWTLKTPAHIYVECETGGGNEPIIPPDGPNGPTEGQVEKLLSGKIIVHCNTTIAHPEKSYGPLKGGYEIGGVEGNASTGYYVNVKVTAAAYITEYSKDFGMHTQASGDPAERKITLVYEDGAWTTVSDKANAIFYAVCQTGGGGNPSDGDNTGGNSGGNTGGNAGGGTIPGGDDGNGGTVTPVAPTNPTEPVVPEDPDDGKTGANDQANPHEVPKTGDNLPMNLVFYAFLAASAAMAMRKITKKESK